MTYQGKEIVLVKDGSGNIRWDYNDHLWPTLFVNYKSYTKFISKEFFVNYYNRYIENKELVKLFAFIADHYDEFKQLVQEFQLKESL